jgi:hypothetical protein
MGYDIGYYDVINRVDNPPIEQGSTFILDFTITLPANIMAMFCEGRVVSGALDTGTGLRAKYRTSLDSVSSVDFAGTIVKTSTTLLTCSLKLTSVQTAGMVAGKGFWDCELYNDDATPYVFKPFGAGNKAKVVGEATK